MGEVLSDLLLEARTRIVSLETELAAERARVSLADALEAEVWDYIATADREALTEALKRYARERSAILAKASELGSCVSPSPKERQPK